MQQYMLHRLQEKHRLIIQLLLLIVLILSHQNATQVYRSCRRLPRSTGWLNIVWHQYFYFTILFIRRGQIFIV